jgi:hypothetical protein
MDALRDRGSHKVKGREHEVKVYAPIDPPVILREGTEGSPQPAGRHES